MVNIDDLIEVYCTRPTCTNDRSRNFILKTLLVSGSFQQQCGCCGMPLILKGNLQRRFLPRSLLIPDEEGGGFGRTFRALDLDSQENRQCVIKQLHPRIPPTSPSQRQRIEQLFRREGEVLQLLDHPQIPQGIDFAVVEASRDLQNGSAQQINNGLEFYIVQQYIEGQNLAQELERNGKFSENQVIDVLLQILPVLDYIHNLRTQNYQGFLHRDIKPSNIMRASQPNSDGTNLYLIDFGAVKQVVVAGVPVEASCILGSPDYMPPEQLAGRPISASSDLYSLAATCVCLLTSKRARELRNGDRWNWKQDTRAVSDNLANILNKMLLPDPQDRYQSAQEVIDCIQEQLRLPLPPQPQPPSFFQRLRRFATQWRWVGLALLVLLGLVIAFAIKYFFLPPCSRYDCKTSNGFSWGEEILIPGEGIKKEDGRKAFLDGKYENAIQDFREYLEQPNNSNDPEALIYLNNAYAAARTNNPIRIAVSIPVSNPDIAQELLRGVAHVQSEVNCSINNYLDGLQTERKFNCNQKGINGRFLQVLIANDNENLETAKSVAKAFVQNQHILGVIGHSTSRIISIVGKIYGQNKLVLISPTSTVSRGRLEFSNYVFRTAYTDPLEAEDLVGYMIHSNPPLMRAVIVKSQDPFSNSLSDEFRQELERKQGQIVGECPLQNSDNMLNIINQCIQEKTSGVNVLLVALPRKYLNRNETIFFVEHPKLKILGGDTMYSPNLTAIGALAINEKLVVAVPWHRNNIHSPFEDTSAHLWKAKVNWRTAMTYDATKAMVEALKKTNNNPSRQGLYEALSQDFSTVGATGKVEFCANHDRKRFTGLGVLVNVDKVNYSSLDSNGPRFDFVIKDIPPRSSPCK